MILNYISDAVENREVIFVELGGRRIESEIVPRDLECLHDAGSSSEDYVPAISIRARPMRRARQTLRYPQQIVWTNTNVEPLGYIEGLGPKRRM